MGTGLLRKGTWAAVWHRRVRRRPWVFTDRRGLDYFFTPQDEVAAFYDRGSVLASPGVERWLETAVRAGDTVVDVGAHLGGVALRAAGLAGPGGAVYAFEPEPVTYSRLANNAILNRVLPTLRVIGEAVTAVEGPVTLERAGAPTSGGHVTRPEAPAPDADPAVWLTVPAIALDRFCTELNLPHVHLLKVSVNGAESAVWQGAAQLLARSAIDRLLVAVDPARLARRGETAAAMLAPLGAAGYVLQLLDADGRTTPLPAGQLQAEAAYHLVATRPGLAPA